MGLLLLVIAHLLLTVLCGAKLFKSSSTDAVHLVVLSSVSYHLVGVRAHVVTLEAVKMRGLVGSRGGHTAKDALLLSAGD